MRGRLRDPPGIYRLDWLSGRAMLVAAVMAAVRHPRRHGHLLMRSIAAGIGGEGWRAATAVRKRWWPQGLDVGAAVLAAAARHRQEMVGTPSCRRRRLLSLGVGCATLGLRTVSLSVRAAQRFAVRTVWHGARNGRSHGRDDVA